MRTILNIDQLISAHWADCDVQAGETPEAYASRHEEQGSPDPRWRSVMSVGEEGWYPVAYTTIVSGLVLWLAIPRIGGGA